MVPVSSQPLDNQVRIQHSISSVSGQLSEMASKVLYSSKVLMVPGKSSINAFITVLDMD